MMDPLISSPEYWWWNQEVFLVSNMADGSTDILPRILMVKPGSIFVSNMAMLMMTFLPGLHFVRGGEKFPRVQLLLPLLLLVAQMCVLMFLEAWGVDVKYRDSEMCSHTHKSHVKFLMVYFTIRVFSVCLLFLRTEFNKKLTHLCLCNSLSVNRETTEYIPV